MGKAKKTRKQRAILPLWIVRDKRGYYYATVTDEEPCAGDIAVDCDALDLCNDLYEACTPKSLHLKPGGRPVKVRLMKV